MPTYRRYKLKEIKCPKCGHIVEFEEYNGSFTINEGYFFSTSYSKLNSYKMECPYCLWDELLLKFEKIN